MLAHGYLKNFVDLDLIKKINSECKIFLSKQKKLTNYYPKFDFEIPETRNLLNSKILSQVKNLLLTDNFELKAVELHIQNSFGPSIPYHQDNFYHCCESDKGLKILIPLQELNKKNGALGFLNHEYNYPILKHEASKIKNFSSEIPRFISSKLNLESSFYSYKVGDASYHFLNSIHYSEGNKMDQDTLFIIFRFQTKDAEIDLQAKKLYESCVKAHMNFFMQNN